MTRDEARALWVGAGLNGAALTDQSMKNLRDKVDAALRGSGLIEGYRANRAPRVTMTGSEETVQITCSAYYFDRREAVTFHRDGFIGFAGWADDINVQPILEAFGGWVADLAPAAPEPDLA